SSPTDLGMVIGSSDSSVVFAMEYFLSVLGARHDCEPAHPSRSFPKPRLFWLQSPTADFPFFGSTSHRPAAQTHTLPWRLPESPAPIAAAPRSVPTPLLTAP